MKQQKELTDEEVFYYNWNRIALLTKKINSLPFKEEKSLRIALQNSQDVEATRKTIFPFIIQSVDKFLKKKK